MQKILKTYLKKLTNLTGNNRSILLLKLSRENDMDLHQLDFLNDKPSFNIIQQLIESKSKINLCSYLDSRNAKVNEASLQLKRIQRKDDFIFEERGSRDLYVGWPFINGKLSDDTLVRCPLIFFPVSIEVVDNTWKMELRKDISVSFNKSFLLAYAYFNKVYISDDFLETTFDEVENDIQVFRNYLYQLLKQSSVEVNFNQDLYLNQLSHFYNYKKQDFEDKFRTGELKLSNEAVLGFFPQAGSYLVPDYECMLEDSSLTNMEDFFYARTYSKEEADTEVIYIQKVKEEQTITPFHYDVSQENAIKAVKKGNSLVVQGPPGTGKSQLICNLISDFIARGKRVLLVSQKRAALDVVHQRLSESEVGDFIGLVHDFKNDRASIFKQINSQIERLDEYKYKNNSLDSLHLERQFIQLSREIDQTTDELEEFRIALFNEADCGISIKELYLSSDKNAPSINLHQAFKNFDFKTLYQFENLLHNFLPYAFKYEKENYPWKDRVSFKDYGLNDQKAICELLDYIPVYIKQLAGKIAEVIDVSLDLDDCEWIADREALIKEFLLLIEEEESFNNLTYSLNKNSNLDWLIVKEKQIRECFAGHGVELSIQKEDLGVFHDALENAWRAKKNIFNWIGWWMFSKDRIYVQRAFVNNKQKWTDEGFKSLIARIDNRMNLEHHLTELRACEWLSGVPEDYNPASFDRWFHYQHTALAAKEKLMELRGLKDFLTITDLDYATLKSKLFKLIDLVRDVPAKRKEWQRYLTPRQISKILAKPEFAQTLKSFLLKDFDSLVEFDKMYDGLRPGEKSVVALLLEHNKRDNVGELVQLFKNSLKLHWIDYIEAKFPVLRSVSTMRMEQLERQLQQAIKEKLKICKEILLLRARENTYRHVNFNRLNNMVTYRELKHQVTKKKKVWPLRKVISSFSHEIFDLIPCWMASPESVSALFPMEPFFDLVIFDEASQCYVEKGIPAIYRAKQIVITGDSKQLPPNDLYSIRYDDETEEDENAFVLETDSLLDVASKYLTRVQLTGHYRSRKPELIDFSNKYFYKNTLRLLPRREDMLSSETAIEFIKVEGLWKNQCNAPEAAKVIDLINSLLKKNPEKTIAVVTFNFKQQMLIQDMLDELFEKESLKRPESLIVKNIENIQGDERDVVIFSVGYARDSNGKLTMNFGSLNAEGGENRLNVAISRAKEKIYLVTSLEASELKVDNVKHEGPKLLQKYLEYAKDVSERRYRTLFESALDKRPEWYLSKQLATLQYEKEMIMSEELPFADLTVIKNQQYSGVVLTDDVSYYTSLSAKDYHGYRPLMLKTNGWTYKRVFSRELWNDKESLELEIRKQFYQ
ncbi:MAG TPA: AAA domain-containing protein [Cytophagaceae bacterium]